MSDERDERPGQADRIERLVRDLLAGRRLEVGPEDAPDRDVILAAARLAGAREPYPRMSPAFRRKLTERVRRTRETGMLSRRTALVAGLGAAFGALAGAGVARVTGILGPASPQPAHVTLATLPGFIDPRPGRWFDAGPLASYTEGQAIRFQAGAVGAFLVRQGDTVHALSSICTHLPCELEWMPANHQLLCRCHNLSFDTNGSSIDGPDGYPLPPLPRLQVRVVDGHVQVQGA